MVKKTKYHTINVLHTRVSNPRPLGRVSFSITPLYTGILHLYIQIIEMLIIHRACVILYSKKLLTKIGFSDLILHIFVSFEHYLSLNQFSLKLFDFGWLCKIREKVEINKFVAWVYTSLSLINLSFAGHSHVYVNRTFPDNSSSNFKFKSLPNSVRLLTKQLTRAFASDFCLWEREKVKNCLLHRHAITS